MKKKDIKTIKKAIESTQSHGVSDTFKFESGIEFFIEIHPVGYQMVIKDDYYEEIHFNDKNNFLLFLSSSLKKTKLLTKEKIQ